MPLPKALDTKLWLAVLHEIDLAGGAAPPHQVVPRIRQHFPEISDADASASLSSGGNRWDNRVRWVRQWLADSGCIEKSTHGVWTMTELGKIWLSANWKGSSADYSSVAKPTYQFPNAKPTGANAPLSAKPSGGVSSEKVGVSGKPVVPKLTTAPPSGAVQISVVSDPVEQLCQRILGDQRKSSAPLLFEQDLAEAFQFLGFESSHIGGSGETDIVVRAPLGQSSYSVVVDAKSTGGGKVHDAQINWPVIDLHRQKEQSTFAAVVGEDFSGGQLQKFADQYKVTLVTTAMLCDVLRMHAKTPFTLMELRSVFAMPGLAHSGVQEVRSRHQEHERHWQLIAEIVDTIEQFDKKIPGAWAPKVENIYLLLSAQVLHGGKSALQRPSQQDVTDAVTFLSSRAVGILTEVAGTNGAFQLSMSAATARRRIRALARSLDSAASGSVGGTAANLSSLSG